MSKKKIITFIIMLVVTVPICTYLSTFLHNNLSGVSNNLLSLQLEEVIKSIMNNQNHLKLYTDTHSLTVGATRSGKTRTIVLETIGNLGLAGESMIISDPKSEINAGNYPTITKIPDLSKWQFNKMFGLGNKEYNRIIREDRENMRVKMEQKKMQLWGDFNDYCNYKRE